MTWTPPYDTGKVKIGLAYEPKNKAAQSHDESIIQDVLLGLYDNRKDQALKRYVGLVLFAFLLLLVVSYAPR
jgi:hypothetical protein